MCFTTGSVTLSTVGYGDILPRSDHTRLVASFLIVVALSFVVYLIGQLSTVREHFPLIYECPSENTKFQTCNA
jgi:voltage-gated potassium channel Kch